MTQAVAIHNKAVELGKHIVRMTSHAGSGHPSSGLSLVHIVSALMHHRMRWDPADPWNPDSDRLILSEGHAVPVIYAAYADLGGVAGKSKDSAKSVTPEGLDHLRTLDSVLDGHPNPAEGFPFFDAATGSLGQGLSVAAGLASAARLDRRDRRFYVLLGDGESREGQIAEALDFVADHKLTNVCAIFNCNGQGQADYVSRQQTAESLARKLAAYGWKVEIIDGHDVDQILAALDQVGRGEAPVAIVAKTVKGWGVSDLQDVSCHGKPLSADRVEAALAELDGRIKPDGDAKLLPATVKSTRLPVCTTSRISLPPLTEAMEAAGMGSAMQSKKLATRKAYGVALMALGAADERVVALDGDVSNSTFANIFAAKYPDRFFECKIAEQNMVSVAVGLFAAGKIPFVSSFGKFLARAYDQIEMASITRANIKLVGSHAGVSLGPDGPSQMSLADVAYFRSYSGIDDGFGRVACRTFLPSDAVSAYRLCELMANTDGMCYMRTHRPDVPFLYDAETTFELDGVKQLRDGGDLTIVASGYMVSQALKAADMLKQNGKTAAVFDVYALPFRAQPILDHASATGGTIITVEDNYGGGVFSAAAEAVATAGAGLRVEGMHCRRIPKSATTADDILRLTGIAPEHIVNRAKALAR